MRTLQILGCISIVALLLAFSGCDGKDMNFPVIGMDKDGNPTQVMVPEAEYSKRLSGLVTTTNDSVLPALKESELKTDWMIRTFVVGIGVNASVGIGPWQVGAVPQTRIAFTNSNSPTLP